MNDRIEKYLKELEEKLIDGERRLVEISLEWAKSFPLTPGVYIVREEGEICYIGESSNLQRRMCSFLDTRTHTLRRTVGNLKFKDSEGFKKIASNKKFDQIFEEELNRIFEDNFEVSAIPVAIGRKELEEKLIEKYSPIYNTTARIKVNESEKSYSVVEIRKNHSNAYKPWTEKEENKLVDLIDEGKSTKEIAEILGRKKGAISSRLKKIREKNEDSS